MGIVKKKFQYSRSPKGSTRTRRLFTGSYSAIREAKAAVLNRLRKK